MAINAPWMAPLGSSALQKQLGLLNKSSTFGLGFSPVAQKLASSALYVHFELFDGGGVVIVPLRSSPPGWGLLPGPLPCLLASRPAGQPLSLLGEAATQKRSNKPAMVQQWVSLRAFVMEMPGLSALAAEGHSFILGDYFQC